MVDCASDSARDRRTGSVKRRSGHDGCGLRGFLPCQPRLLMETVLQYRIPVLHPLVVHFPLSLLLASALVACVWVVRGTVFWRRCLLLLMVLGTAGSALAYLTGDAMEEQSEGVPIVDALIDLHEQMGLFTLVAALISLISLAVFSVRQEQLRRNPFRHDPLRDPLPVRLMLSLLVFLSAALVAWTAHIGGTMVWGVPR